MKARDIMTANPQVATPRDQLDKVARIMRDSNVGIVPIVDSTDAMKPIGVVTDRDIAIRCVAEGKASNCAVDDFMTRDNLNLVSPDSEVDEVMQKMARDQLRRILVAENGRLVGIIAQADIVLQEGEQDPELVEETLERISAPSVPIDQYHV